MKSNYSFVNVFQGSGKIDLPKPEGLASKWLFIKAQCGNTTPAAAYPFGKMSLCAYTGAYPTGYGNLVPNSCGDPQSFDAKVHGFSHMHVSGTGGIRAYYNYAVTSPIIGNILSELNDMIVEENATPGFYSAKLSSAVRFEGTVSQKLAYHRYTFPDEGLLQIDFSNSGLNRKWNGFYSLPENAVVSITSSTRVTAHIKVQGIDLYFATDCPSSKGVFLWQNYIQKNGTRLYLTDKSERFGAAFRVNGVAELKMAISFVSSDAAVAMLDSEDNNFDTVKAQTEEKWCSYLNKIIIKTDDPALSEIFYSNLYHTLIKPCNGCGESYIYDASKADGNFYFDFATLWDQYKTAIHLILTLYPNEANGIINTLLYLTESNGRSPINVTVAENNDFTDQARMLVEHIFADYHFRYGEKYIKRMLEATKHDLEEFNKDFIESGYCKRYTHILDICEALNAMSVIARTLGENDTAERFETLASRWINAFDVSTGMMSTDSPYYEGTNKNYSFRLLHNMQERIDLIGKERFVAELDELFGYSREPVKQSASPIFDPLELGINSFEGFNNESDMEAPYAYLYAGRHDRTCEIIRAGMKYMFTRGRGGLPGNNDSGGLSSCYVWNALGLFPVAGQDLILIGSPIVNEATLLLPNNKAFHITAHNNSDKNIYVEKVLFNSQKVEGYKISVSDMMNGGNLDVFMTSSPD